MPTKQGFGEFNAHNSSRENVSAGTVVFAWISMPSFDSSTNRSILLLAVICWWNLPFVCCFSVARSVCVHINNSRLEISCTVIMMSSGAQLNKESTHSNRAVVYEMRNNIIRAIQLFLSTQRQWRRMRRKASQYMNIAETNGYAGAIAIRSPLLLQISPAWVS